MKLKNYIFVNGFIPALQELLNEKLPITQAFKLRKLAKVINEKAKVYDETRRALLDQVAAKDKNGEVIKDEKGNVKFDNLEKWNTEFIELLEQEEEYDIEPIELANSVEMSANNVTLLEQILKG